MATFEPPLPAPEPDPQVGPDPDWTAYRLAIFGDPYLVWHEGPDFTALRATTGPDRALAARMLLTGLREGDDLAAQGIRELRLLSAVPALEQAARTGDPRVRIRSAQALLALTGRQEWSATVATVLDAREFWGVRMDAAIALREFLPTPQLTACLARAVQDDEYLVRYHAASTLLAQAGRKPDASAYKRWFPRVSAPGGQAQPTDQDRAGWRAVARELSALLG
ncbi:HEAT repeat domain-containing protein [Streptacidiphilus sp. EB129]|uniref:HEAT repeat domain-containing protein n=1 Tax=Streptacidiphilus sp. EB129 TaxID=3156262 RepID=UPI0035152791